MKRHLDRRSREELEARKKWRLRAYRREQAAMTEDERRADYNRQHEYDSLPPSVMLTDPYAVE